MKKILSMVLAVVMLLSCMSVMALADTTYPELKNLTMAATEVTAPGKIAFTAEVTDERITFAQAVFYCTETKQSVSAVMSKTYWTEEGEVPYEDGKLHGELYVNEFIADGTFELTNIYLDGESGIFVNYTSEFYPEAEYPEYVKEMPEEFKSMQITVSGSQNPDITPPVLKSITVSETVTTDPSKVEIIVDAADENSGVSHVSMDFWCEETGTYLWTAAERGEWDDEIGEFKEYEDGKLHGKFEVNGDVKPGAYKLMSIYVQDNAGNVAAYDSWNEGPYDAHYPEMKEEWKALQIEVVTEMPAVTYGDANGDGAVNAKDAMLTLQFYTKKIAEDKLDTKAVDVDGSGSVNAKDAMLILQKYTKKLTEFPVEKK